MRCKDRVHIWCPPPLLACTSRPRALSRNFTHTRGLLSHYFGQLNFVSSEKAIVVCVASCKSQCTQTCLDYLQECGCFCLLLWRRKFAADHSTVYEACHKLREKALQTQIGCITVHNAVPVTSYLGFRSV